MATADIAVRTAPEVTFGKMESGALIPRNFEGLYRMAQIMAASGMMPKGVSTPEAVFVAVQMGLELGLGPMQAVQSIAVINGRPSIWGDAVLALVRGSGLLEDIEERFDGAGDMLSATCTVKRRGESKPIVRTFSVSDARTAGLWGKEGPWKQYPKRMLQMRARSWAIRDAFGDVLKGFRSAEEIMDYDADLAQSKDGAWSVQHQAKHQDSPDDAIEAGSSVPSFDERCADLVDIDRMVIDQFVEQTAAKNRSSVDAVKDQAAQNWDRFVKALRRFAAKKQAETQPQQPVAEEIGQQPKGNNGGGVPISFTREYKDLMALGADFPEAYNTARKNTNLKPDTVENCIALIASTKEAIDVMNSDQI